VTEQVSVGQYLALPYDPFVGNAAKNTVILDGCVNLPNLFPLPGTVEERRVIVASWLTNPAHLFWEVWASGNVVGVVGLTRIVVGLDALAHLAFFDRQLWARRTLVLRMMAWAFRELRLQRLSVEIPDHLEPLIRFCRAKLGFRYEGELLAAAHPKVQGLEAERINGPARWVARWGARRERMHFDAAGTLHDLVCLRLLREELVG
jgi:RimJ/RimL family protein N-acetyltransferase